LQVANSRKKQLKQNCYDPGVSASKIPAKAETPLGSTSYGRVAIGPTNEIKFNQAIPHLYAPFLRLSTFHSSSVKILNLNLLHK
jgi:hypothetical protein